MMAFFERADERDPLITCNICNVKCAERSITQHKSKCADRNSIKFTSGKLLKCRYDSGHVVKPEEFKLHLEFCTKRQNDLRAEYQREIALNHKKEDTKPVEEVNLEGHDTEPGYSFANADDWGVQADRKPYRMRMRYK